MSCGSPPKTAPGKMRLCWPIVTRPMIVTLLISCVPRPMRALCPTTQNGPIRTSSSSSARGSTTALGSTWVGMVKFRCFSYAVFRKPSSIRDALTQAALAEPFGFLRQNEGSRRSELRAKHTRRDFQLNRLPADRAVRAIVEPIFDGEPGTSRRPRLDPRVVIPDPRDIDHHQSSPEGGLLNNPRRDNC